MKITYSHLQSYFDTPLPSEDDVCTTFTFGAFEIEGVDEIDVGGKIAKVIDVKVLPNRAHDCLSWLGIAREYAALTGITMKSDPFLAPCPVIENTDGKGKELRLEIEDAALNSLHTLSYIRNVTVGPSPAWLREALEAVGQRSINNVVDATNFAMLEYGQPTHAFDAGKFTTADLSGVKCRGIRIRHARPGEKLTILGGKEVALDQSVQVLADAISGTALDIAGVKGGLHAELDDSTTEVIITSGKYDATNIRKTTQFVGIRTDASKRFENEIPHLLPYYGQQRVQELILQVAGGEVVEVVSIDALRNSANNHPVSMPADRVRSTLGSSVTNDQIVDTLTRLHLAPNIDASQTLTVTPPWWRFDIEIPEDIVEEVGRVMGYDTVPATPLPTGRTSAVPNSARVTADAVRQLLRTDAVVGGFYELLTYSLANTGEVALANSLAEDKGYMRATLTDGMVAALAQNEFYAPGVGVYDCLKLFEIGRVFKMINGARVEQTHVCVGVRYLAGKKREEKANALLLQVKDALQDTLGVQLDYTITKDALEFILSEVSPDKVAVFSKLTLPTVPNMRYAPISHFPVALRDVAFWSTSLDLPHLQHIITTAAGPLLVRADLFDTFTKDTRTSYAFHLAFVSHTQTLTDTELVPVMEHIYTALKAEHCEIR
jgi:phenylalanyl-tRNA synthetase beta chain